MPKTKTVTLYQYEELSDKAKEKARDWFREGTAQDFDTDCVFDDAAAIAELLGVDIRQRAVKLMNGQTRFAPSIFFSGFSSQGDGACFEGAWRASDVKPGKVKEHAPQDKELHSIAETFERVARDNPEGFFRVTHRGHYSHSGCTSFDFDELSDEAEEDIRDAARLFMDWIYSQLEKEWEYQNSDDTVAENICANEYTFLADGTRED